MRFSKDENQLLRGAVGWQKKLRPAGVVLGSVVQVYLKRRENELSKNASVMDVWSQMLPPMLAAHCRPESIQSGTLRVEVDPGPWMHEFRLVTGELLDMIQERCPRNRVRRIACIPRREDTQENGNEQPDV